MKAFALGSAVAVGVVAFVAATNTHTAHAHIAVPPTVAAPVRTAKNVAWPPAGEILNQGAIGACTGFAVAGLLGRRGADGLRIYALATRLDTFPGTYPAQDTGSTLTAALKAARKLGYIHSFTVIGSASTALATLVTRPVAVELVSGKQGHALVLLGRHGDTLTLQNSWGPTNGQNGLDTMSVTEFTKQFIDGAYTN